jgi:S1-C subfamily serine protease
LLLWLLAVTGAPMVPASSQAHDFAESVVMIRAVDRNGAESLGSAVVVAADTLATACHVIRDARVIHVSHAGGNWVGKAPSGSPAHDFCIVVVPDLGLPQVSIRVSSSLRTGERVVAAGFPGGGVLATHPGTVEVLYPFDGGNVIRTSAQFDAGSSGGGLFDADGNLVGLLAFKARTGARMHFALPAEWSLPGTIVASLLGPLEASAERSAFWEWPKATQPAFLRHSLVEAASRR